MVKHMEKGSCILTVTFILIFTSVVQGQHDPGRVKQNLLKGVVKILLPPDESGDRRAGTGFLVSKEITRNGHTYRQTFLVTTKHMLGDWNLADGDIARYHNGFEVFFYRTTTMSGRSYEPMKISLSDRNEKIKDKVYLHPNGKIDVAMIALDEELDPSNRIDLITFDVGDLLPFNKIISSNIGLGDQVFAIGYPLGITSLRDNYPFAKFGYVASLPGTQLVIEATWQNRKKEIIKTNAEGKIILLDGLIVVGNSGSPVVLPAEMKSRVNAETNSLEWTPIKNQVIGIVSGGWSMAGLTVVYSSDYILELIDLYLKETHKKSN